MSINFIGSLPESLTQELLVGKLLVGGLGVRNASLMLERYSYNPVHVRTNLVHGGTT